MYFTRVSARQSSRAPSFLRAAHIISGLCSNSTPSVL